MIKRQHLLQLKKSNSPFFKRLIAYFIDWYLVSFLTIIPINFIYGLTYNQINFESTITTLPILQSFIAFLIGLLFSIIYLIYFPYKNNGQTLGKKILKLKIIKSDNNKLDLKTLFIRNGVGLILIEGTFYTCSIYFWELINLISSSSISSAALSILGIISFSSLAVSLITNDHKMIHDFIAKTNVISTQSKIK
ncbi:RDD family protein [Clostridium paraputrificum]|uniref:RDD family protein n=1 Tax=Clostridium paraputrificum TaxID=29363 RepID=A0A6N3CLZ5_9CLOT